MRFYVDGSWDEQNKIGAWSVVQVVRGRPNKILSGRVYGRDFSSTDVELIAAMKALEYAKKQNHKKITLFHDYTGTAGVATGNWTTKSETARRYREFVRNSGVNVNFVRVSDKEDRFMKLAHKVAFNTLKKKKRRKRVGLARA